MREAYDLEMANRQRILSVCRLHRAGTVIGPNDYALNDMVSFIRKANSHRPKENEKKKKEKKRHRRTAVTRPQSHIKNRFVFFRKNFRWRYRETRKTTHI